jgi:hypothetical protein
MNSSKSETGPQLTIVGGQPSGGHRKGDGGPVPAGVERILRRAAQDAAFRSRLLDDRAACLWDSGVELSASERAALLATGWAALAAMIENVGSDAGRTA